jgi:type IV pilus assembly protein PilB
MMMWSWLDATGQKCAYCNGTGYKWRVWVYEMMEYSDEVRNQLVWWKTAYEIENYALSKGMINLERDGILKVIKWYTALEEIYRIVKHKKLMT